MFKLKKTDCPDCGAKPGESHAAICDVGLCPVCGIQAIQCSKHNAVQIWTGYWPGDKECVKYDLYSKWVNGKGWEVCSKYADGAGPDLNTLGILGKWNSETQMMEIRR